MSEEQTYEICFLNEDGDSIEGWENLVLTQSQFILLKSAAEQAGLTIEEFVIESLRSYLVKNQDNIDDNGTNDTTSGTAA